MLYDGLVGSLSRAVEAVREGRIEEAHNALIKSQEIILELDASLNMDYEISRHLHAVYDFLHRQAVDANVHKDAGMAESCLALVKELRSAWRQVIDKQAGVTATDAAELK